MGGNKDLEPSHTENPWKLKWNILFNSSPESIMILSENYTILEVNETTLKMLGKSREDVVGKKCYEIFHHAQAPPEGCPAEEMKKKGWKPSANEMQTIIGDFIVKVMPIKIPGEERKILHFARDITLITKLGVKLINSLQRYISFLNTLVELDSLLLGERSLEEMVKKGARIICENENFDACWVVLKGGNGLKTAGRFGVDWDIEERYDVESLEFQDNPWIEKIEGKSFVFLPLKVEDRFLGLIVLLKNGEEEISEDEINILKIMADNMAIAIRERRLEVGRAIAYRELEKNIQSFALLVDGIRNPLAVIMGIAEIEMEEKTREKIIEQIRKIDEIIQKIDERWSKSEYLRSFLKSM